ncbi:unnamed protein product [Somion occarium]|uniref:Methyltransferase ausD n=1 Tax=Somion occarium TaxID=3059160 RepID=A0ABP1E9M3_9APHY
MSTEHETKVESEELVVAPIDERLYSLEPDELEFFKSWTKIQDEEELKRHILKSQADAYAVYPYPCIRRFSFTKLKISRFPAYQDLLQLGRERPGALFIDLGCCFGNDVRKAVADGFPVQQALASDLRPGFWEVGHQLFKDTKETFPVPFIPGDVFDIKFVSDEPGKVETTTELPPLSSLINLTPLLGCLSAIHTSSFFHLFDEEQQFHLAKKVASLLSAEPGSIIFGSHVGRFQKEYRTEVPVLGLPNQAMFCHCPESWVEMWEKQVFQEDEVRAWAMLHEVERHEFAPVIEGKYYLLVWSVTRL